jgi:hypothetical protein
MRATGIGRSAVVAIALLSGLSAGSTTAAADQLEPRPWSVSHGGASASGTANFVREDPFTYGMLTVEGTLQVNDSGCYYARATVVDDLAPIFRNVAEQCGPGTEPIDSEFAIWAWGWNASITICRVDGECGQEDPIY